MFRTLSIAAFALAASTIAASASAVFNFATVTVDQNRGTLTGTGNATITNSLFGPVASTTIGTISTNASNIVTSLKLDGGLNFAEGNNFIDLSNIVIDTTNNLIVADVNVNGTSTAAVALFAFSQSIFGQTLAGLTNSTFGFSFTATGASDFNVGLGLTSGNSAKTGKNGGTFGIVPEPATVGVLGLSLVLIAAARRRRAA